MPSHLPKESLRKAMTATRERTLWLLSQVPEEFLKKRVHSFYSPIGWHFGHIARTEEYWIICKALGRPCLDEDYTFLFADLPENPKDNRVHLPSRDEIVEYMAKVRRATFDALEEADLNSEDPFLADAYAWDFALQHECQHQETICEMMQLINRSTSLGAREALRALECHGGTESSIADRGLAVPAEYSRPNDKPRNDAPQSLSTTAKQAEMVHIPAGRFCMGSDDPHGYDNEKQAHEVSVEAFEMARTPVTASQWIHFIDDRGYARAELWSEEGWAWRLAENAVGPEYWLPTGAYAGPRGPRDIHPDEPVSCVSWFEADAYARWAGMRLPTEKEWEYAARGPDSRIYPWGPEVVLGARQASHGMTSWGPEPVGSHPDGASSFGLLDIAGNVWEWTSSPFLPYPGFQAFPYDGYSKEHMLGHHKVCRGGSWATSPRILRSSFRNWYVPTYRQGFLGVRLAR